MDKCNKSKSLNRVFMSVLLEVSGMTSVEIITLKSQRKIPCWKASRLLTRCYYAVSNLNSADCLFSMNFPFKCASL